MYALVDTLCFLGGIAGFIIALKFEKPYLVPIPILWVGLYPFVTETLYNFMAKLCGKWDYNQITLNSRLVYDDGYNISFCGIEKMHPFDAQKYANTYKILEQRGIIGKDVIKPNKIPRRLLLEKVSKYYLIKLCYSLPLSSYIEMPLFFLPNFLLRWRVLNPMLLATEGTILASIASLKLKWAINLSGGYHHAHCESGGGFCIYPDITLAIHYLQTRHNIGKAMIIDLDAHQGNGHERDHLGNPNVYIIDAYNHGIYPRDQEAKQAIADDIKVIHSMQDKQFLRKVSQAIEKGIATFQPEFILYNAGTDCLVGDPLGNLSLSEEGVIKRDELVIELALKHSIPIAMVLSGGYQKINARVIANSIQNLYEKFDK